MPKSTTHCPICKKEGIREDNLKRHMESNHKGEQPPVPINNVVAMEEDALLDAAIAIAQRDREKQIARNNVATALPKIPSKSLKERFPMSKFLDEYHAHQIRVAREFHKSTFGVETCGDRCSKKGTYCGYVPSLAMYPQSIVDSMYDSWLRKKQVGSSNLDALAFNAMNP